MVLKWIRSALFHGIVIFFCIFAVFPLLMSLSNSFKSRGEMYSTKISIVPQKFTLENYRFLLDVKNSNFLRWTLNSLIVCGGTTLISLLLGMPAAYGLSRFRFRHKRTILLGLIFTQMFPGAVLVIPLYFFLNSIGLLGSLPGLALTYITINLPVCIWLLKNSFDQAGTDVEEAAWLDGLSPWTSFLKIVIPFCTPGILAAGFFSFLVVWNEILFAVIFQQREILYTIPIGFNIFTGINNNWALLSAGSIMVSLPVIVLGYFSYRFFVGSFVK